MSFQNHWYVSPGVMGQRLREIVARMNSCRPQGTPGISERDISVIVTADDHSGKPFMWAKGNNWLPLLRTRIGESRLDLHLETFQGDESKVALEGILDQVPLSHRFGWELEVFRPLLEAYKIAGSAMLRQPTTYTEEEKRKIESNLRKVAMEGLLQKEWGDIHRAVYAPRVSNAFEEGVRQKGFIGGLQAAYNAVKGVPFHGALQTYIKAEKALDSRTLQGVHQRMASKIQRIINLHKSHLHLVSAGDAHLKHPSRRQLYEFITPPVGTYGIVDSQTK